MVDSLAMPRANRYILPGRTYHLTHRCHNRAFLLRFARDRDEYRRRLRGAVLDFGVSMLTYCVTCNHTHLLVRARDPETVSRLMQKLEGEFAEYYNIRKHRSGAFRNGRYGCTMIDGGEHLWNCMKYIDLNMVRAGVVQHPSQWEWCGYRELMGLRQRYRFLAVEELLAEYGGQDLAVFRANYGKVIADAIARRLLQREPHWTESVAVGSESYVKAVVGETRNRVEMAVESRGGGQWTVRESAEAYGAVSGQEMRCKAQKQRANSG